MIALMEVLAVDNAPHQPSYNNDLIGAIEKFASCTRIDHRFLDEDPSIAQEFGAVILSGVPYDYSFKSIDNRESQMEWIKDTDTPILGICLGLQSIGKVFGAEVKRGRGENGLIDLNVFEEDAILEGLGKNLPVRALHRAAITLPEDFTHLAGTDKCPVQVIRHNTLPIWAVQFHPEDIGPETTAATRETGEQFMNNFINSAAQPKKVEPTVVDFKPVLFEPALPLGQAEAVA